jgi:hypothetical protein
MLRHHPPSCPLGLAARHRTARVRGSVGCGTPARLSESVEQNISGVGDGAPTS